MIENEPISSKRTRFHAIRNAVSRLDPVSRDILLVLEGLHSRNSLRLNCFDNVPSKASRLSPVERDILDHLSV